MKYIQKLLVSVTIVLMLIMIMPQNIVAASDSKGIDVVMVIDVSGSMNDTDPERISEAAAKLFIDMMQVSGSRVGVVTFSTNYNEIPLTTINNANDKSILKDKLTGLTRIGPTDIGLALEKAVDMLKNAENVGNDQMILFLTDGQIDINKNGRTNEISMADTKKAISEAEDRYKIYSIGLNVDGTVDKDLINLVATTTNGRAYIVDNTDGLPDIYNEIFADFIQSNIINVGTFVLNGKDYQEIPVEIPGNGVVEANFIMMSTGKITELIVVDPEEQIQALNQSSLIFTKTKEYSLLKMVKPQQGQWLLKVNGDAGCEVHINLIFNYDIMLQMKYSVDEDARLNVEGFLTRQDMVVSDQYIYDSFVAKVYLQNNSGAIAEYPMQYNDGRYVAEISNIEDGHYLLWVGIDSDNIYRETEKSEVDIINPINVEKPVALEIHLPETIELKGFISIFGKKLKVSDYVNIEALKEENSIRCKVDDEKVLSANVKQNEKDIEKNTLVLKGLADGETILTLEFIDKNEQVVSEQLKVQVDYTIYGILPIVLGLVIIFILLVVAVKISDYLRKMKSPWYGSLKCVIRTDGIAQNIICNLNYLKGELSLGKILAENGASGDIVKKANGIKLFYDKKVNAVKVTNKSKLDMSEPVINRSRQAILENKQRIVVTNNEDRITATYFDN